MRGVFCTLYELSNGFAACLVGNMLVQSLSHCGDHNGRCRTVNPMGNKWRPPATLAKVGPLLIGQLPCCTTRRTPPFDPFMHLIGVCSRRRGNLKATGDDRRSISTQEEPRLIHAMRTVIRTKRVSPAPQKAGSEMLAAKGDPGLHVCLITSR